MIWRLVQALYPVPRSQSASRRTQDSQRFSPPLPSRIPAMRGHCYHRCSTGFALGLKSGSLRQTHPAPTHLVCTYDRGSSSDYERQKCYRTASKKRKADIQPSPLSPLRMATRPVEMNAGFKIFHSSLLMLPCWELTPLRPRQSPLLDRRQSQNLPND